MEHSDEGVQEIHRWFGSIPHPGNDNLLYKGSGYMDDGDIEFLYSYENRPWQSINLSRLEVEGSCMTSLSDKGLQYILPAYLVLFRVHGFDPNGYGWIDRILEQLASKGKGEMELSSRQFAIIEKYFLQEVEKAWLTGKWSSEFDIDVQDALQQARMNYGDMR